MGVKQRYKHRTIEDGRPKRVLLCWSLYQVNAFDLVLVCLFVF